MRTIEEKLEAIKEINEKKDRVEMSIDALARHTQNLNIDLGGLSAVDIKEIREFALSKYKKLREQLIKDAEAIINGKEVANDLA